MRTVALLLLLLLSSLPLNLTGFLANWAEQAAPGASAPLAPADGDADPAPLPSPSPELPEPPITVNLVGDILLASTVGSNIAKYGADYPFEETAELLADADITFGNLETSVSTRGKPADKQFTFRSTPESLEGLVNAGFDGVSVANNHTLDYGVGALQDTLANLDEYKLGHTGAGDNEEEAFEPYVQEVRGKKVAIIGISRVLPEGSWYAGKNKPGIAQGYLMEPMMTYIKKAVSKSDYTIVFIHWNKETKDYPEDYARTYAKEFIDAGVDAVIGAHSHSLQGIEWYKGKPVFYSLGNFIFTSKSEKSSQSMILKLSFEDDQVGASVTPVQIVNTQAKLRDDKYNQAIIGKLNKISFNAVVGKDGTVREKEKEAE
ncbi:CapA family protein [Cohnella lubricantis]|uniref:CapA family protein n=1 Tax=Cohnella lubricantis TaxID=2163172 RepID=A0A841TD75_9BACL|nr:CapA family protein [Cohnella lubricantis]MBB6676927.1 CapA family protein [Cohnella lubricantis]MBP2118331.1 poly-gamma-glutamate synthesis protein (capsule biosynthesis protein) [Cohnella lubricantis]